MLRIESPTRLPSRRNYSQRIALALLALWLAAAPLTDARAATAPGDVLRRYLQARRTGDLGTARTLWDSRDLRRAGALGIRFDNIEAAFDDYWMLSTGEREQRVAETVPAFVDSTLEEERARFTVVLASKSDGAPLDTLAYELQARNDSWSISLPYLNASRAWTRREGRYFRLRSKRLARVSQHALNVMDTAIDAAFDQLGTPTAARLRLERVKLEYFLCENAEDVRSLVGSTAREGYLPGGGRVVSRVCPDMNAVTRLLVHLTLRETPLHNVHLFEEGLAAALGGTDDLGVNVLLTRARDQARKDPEWIASPFEPTTFGSEEVVAAEALWCNALLGELGPPAFAELLRALGGTSSEVAARGATEVRGAIELATGKSAADLDAWVRAAAQDIEPILRPGCHEWPVDVFGLEPVVRWRDSEGDWSLHGYEVGEEFVVAVMPWAPGPPAWRQSLIDSLTLEATGEHRDWPVPERDRPDGDPPTIVMLARVKLDRDVEPYESRLFREQYLDRMFKNDLFGLFVSPDEVRLYDYSQNKLVAEFDTRTAPPGGLVYYDEEPGHICFRFRRDLLAKPITAYYVALFRYTGE